MRKALALLGWMSLSALSACAPREPACTAAIDRTGRGVPVCDTISEAVVCDDPGAEARYERDVAGRLVLIDGTVNNDDLELAARLTARFGKGRDTDSVILTVTDIQGNSRELKVTPLPATEIPPEWYL